MFMLQRIHCKKKKHKTKKTGLIGKKNYDWENSKKFLKWAKVCEWRAFILRQKFQMYILLSLNQTLLTFLIYVRQKLDDSTDSGNFSVRGYLLWSEKILLLICMVLQFTWTERRTSFCMGLISRKLTILTHALDRLYFTQSYFFFLYGFLPKFCPKKMENIFQKSVSESFWLFSHVFL